MRPKRRGLPLTLDTVTESTLVLNISSTAALICGLVAWSATRNTYWRFLSATKVLFSDTTGASTTLIRRSALYFLVAVISASPRAAEMTATRKYSAERLMSVVLAPVVSEKSTFVADKNRQYVFLVADQATKPQIKAAVELMFKIKVDSVTVSNVKGKPRRFGRIEGRRRNWKKAYVRLAAGQEINFAATQ